MRHGWSPSGHVQQTRQHGLQVEAPVEAILEFGQVAVQMGLPDPAGHAHDVPLQVPQDGVHPGEGWVPPAPPAARHLVWLVLEPSLGQEVVGLPAIREDGGAGGESPGEPGLQFPPADIPEDLHPHMEDHSGIFGVGLHGHDKGCLTGSTSATLPKVTLAAHIGIVHLDPAREDRLGLPLQHYLHDLLLHGPGGLVVDPKLALQFQGRDGVLALGEQVHGLEPDREGELRALEDGPGGRAGLLPAVLALEQATGQAAVAGGPALGAHEAMRPAGLADGLDAQFLGAVASHELPEREALLKLDVVPRHVAFSTENIGSSDGHFLSHTKKLEASPTFPEVSMPSFQAEGYR